MATLDSIEHCILHSWDRLLTATSSADQEGVTQARSDLAASMGYLLNVFLEANTDWTEFGADDLLEAKYEFPTTAQMKVVGLMCWGSGDNFLSPFAAEFKRSNPKAISDFVLYFGAATPSSSSFILPYTRDDSIRLQLLESRPSSPENWPLIYRRSDIATQLQGRSVS